MTKLRQWRLVGSAEGEERHFWLDKIVFGLDRLLSRWQSVVEYTHDPTCILRITLGRLDQDFVLTEGTPASASSICICGTSTSRQCRRRAHRLHGRGR